MFELYILVDIFALFCFVSIKDQMIKGKCILLKQ